MKGNRQTTRLAVLGENSLLVLKLLAKGTAVTSIVVTKALIEAFLHRQLYSKKETYQARRIIDRLEKQGIITLVDNDSYQVTKRGHWEAARRRILDKPNTHVPSNWDGTWRIVIFDVPELQRQHRDVLRYAIKGYGMHQLQKSVWVYPYDCSEFVKSIKNDLGYSIEVLYIEASHIENQQHLEREYELRENK